LAVTSTLASDHVQHVLAGIQAAGVGEYELAEQRLQAREAEVGARFYGRERAEIVKALPLAIRPEVGQVLYALTVAARPEVVVEFGGSMGFSTICLASALRDVGVGVLITTELIGSKAERLAANLAAADLADLVEIRVGDAMRTLAELAGEIDLLFLDGSNDLYLPLLQMCEPRLAAQGLVVADLSHDEPYHDRYRDYVLSDANRYATTEVAFDAGLIVSSRL
jgi:predicted O-methyltransferase YrrM